MSFVILPAEALALSARAEAPIFSSDPPIAWDRAARKKIDELFDDEDLSATMIAYIMNGNNQTLSVWETDGAGNRLRDTGGRLQCAGDGKCVGDVRFKKGFRKAGKYYFSAFADADSKNGSKPMEMTVVNRAEKEKE